MINGIVRPDLHPTVRLAVFGPQDKYRIVDAIIDTGFNGELSLPSGIVDELDLPWLFQEYLTLGNGQRVTSDIYSASIQMGDIERDVRLDCAETDPLIGLELLRGMYLAMDVVVGGTVTLIDRTR